MQVSRKPLGISWVSQATLQMVRLVYPLYFSWSRLMSDALSILVLSVIRRSWLHRAAPGVQGNEVALSRSSNSVR